MDHKLLEQTIQKMPETMKHNFRVLDFATFFDCYFQIWIWNPKQFKLYGVIIFALYREITGMNYDSEWFKCYGILNPKK